MSEHAPLTILFTDVEGSTDLRTSRGDVAAHEILRAHEEVVRGCVASHDGREVKALGDGFLIAFTSVRKALACAVAIQRVVEGERRKAADQTVRVRIGVTTGEVVEEDSDLYGQAVNAAARIAARAAGGEILVAEVSRQLVGTGPQFVFSDRGRVRLKGFPDRWRLYELAWAPPQEAGPGVFGPVDRTPLVGREAERAELSRLLDGTVAGKGGVALIGGEPGVGKTRLAEELMAEAERRGLRVYVGHSYEMEGAAPYVAIVEIMETALARAPSPQAWRQFLGDEAPEVAKLVPKLRQLCPDIPASIDLPAEQERRLLFSGVRDVVERTARRRPVLLVFDDLQWADDPTLLFVEYLAEHIAEVPVLIVATYRDTEVDAGRPLAKTFEDLRRRRLARWIRLGRLPEDEVARMLRALAGREPPPGLVGAIYTETEGNPFFVEEVYKHLDEEGRLFDADLNFRPDLQIGELDVPAGVRLVISRRLRHLQVGTPPVLTAAAVVGRMFSVELLEAMGKAEPDAILDAVEDAHRARLIVSAPDPSGEDRFIFAHELIRQTLLADVSRTRRQRLHARVADALEHHYAGDLDQHAAAIAHHLLEAGSAGNMERAFRYLNVAGRFAMAGAAFEEALRHYERAATIDGLAEPAERAELLFELGTARCSAGRFDTAVEAWRRSADAFEQLDDGEGVARVCAAASYSLAWLARWAEAIEMSQRGLVALGDRVTPDRGRLLGMTGCMTAWGGEYATGVGMIDEELQLADRLEDASLLAHALSMKALAHHAFVEYREVVEAGRRATTVLDEPDDLWTLASVAGFMAFGLVYGGRFDEFPALDDEFAPLAERLGNDGAILCFRRMRALLEYLTTGDLDRLEALARADRGFCETAGLPWVSSAWSWSGLARFLRGDWDDALELFREAVRLEPPGILCGWNAALLFECLAYQGETTAALDLLDARVLPSPGEPKPWGATAVLVTAVDGLVVLGERERAAELYPSVVDVFERTGMVCPAYDDARLGHRAAGIAALAGQRFDAAEEHFRTALRQAAELPHRPEEAHTRRWYGQMLVERNGPGDREQAEKVLHQALKEYRRMGMPRHCDLTAGLLSAC